MLVFLIPRDLDECRSGKLERVDGTKSDSVEGLSAPRYRFR